MYNGIILFLLTILFLLIASIYDLKTRLIPNWICVTIAILGFLYNLVFGNLLGSIIVFILFFIIGNLMYEFKFFAGGDAKLIMLIGFSIPGLTASLLIYYSLAFLFLLCCSMCVYGVIARLWKKQDLPFVPGILIAYSGLLFF